MAANLTGNISNNKSRPAFNSNLNEMDTFANILFVIGVITALQSTDVTRQSITLGQTRKLSSQEENAFVYDITKLLALANWIYLSAGVVFLNTASARLEEQITISSTNASLSNEEKISGRKLILFGSSFKIIGYILSAAGNEIIADSTRIGTNS